MAASSVQIEFTVVLHTFPIHGRDRARECTEDAPGVCHRPALLCSPPQQARLQSARRL